MSADETAPRQPATADAGYPRAPLSPVPADRRFLARAALAQLLVTVLLFAGHFPFDAGHVIARPSGDLQAYYYPLRTFAFGQIAAGNFPFWDPTRYTGLPCFANPQAALLYPPNYLHLLLPVAAAINLTIVLHQFLAGFAASLFFRQRRLSPTAAIAAGAFFSLSSGPLIRIFGGHLNHVCTIAYAPLIFYLTDLLFDRPRRRAVIGLAVAVALQSLAGHVQVAYYTGLAVAVYAVVRLPSAPRRAASLAALTLAAALGLGLAAVQLVPSMLAGRDTLRAGGTSPDFVATDSVRPANFLELLVPELLGFAHPTPYVGADEPTEVKIYCGAAVLVLAVLGTLLPSHNRRIALAMVVASALIAMGSHTPLFKLLYHALPGFDLFRCPGRFLFILNLFLALLAGAGIDALTASLRNAVPSSSPRPRTLALAIVFLLAPILTVVATLFYTDAGQPDGRWRAFVASLHDASTPLSPAAAASFAATAAHAAARTTAAGTAIAALGCALLTLRHRPRLLASVIPAIAILELLPLARTYTRPSPAVLPYPPEWRAALDEMAPDQRVFTLDPNFANAGALTGHPDASGFDPAVPRRFGQFLAASQRLDPDHTYFLGQFTTVYPSLFPLARVRHVLYVRDGDRRTLPLQNPLPHLLLVSHAITLPDRDAILSTLASPGFDRTQHVLFEPGPTALTAPPGALTAAEFGSPSTTTSPTPAPAATVNLLSQSTDSLEIEINTPTPTHLLITDAYAPGWQASPHPDSAQQRYAVLPANFIHRAIPLTPGHHHLTLHYTPPGLHAGLALTTLSLLVTLALPFTTRRRKPPRLPPTPG